MFLYVCNPYFCFTQDALMSFVLVFQKDRLLKFTCYELSSCKIFQEFVLGLDLFGNSTSDYEFSDLRLLS